ncbi:MAG: hypothetical protein ACRD9L_28575 [Bryobacteraceae bacterium]
MKEYIEEPAKPWPAQLGPGPGLPGLEWEFVNKFRTIAGIADRARLIKDDIAPDSVCPGPSALVEIKLSERPEPVTEQLRIEIRTGLVCESKVQRRRFVRVTPAEYTSKTEWIYRKLSGPVDASLFLFVPPQHTKRVERFRKSSLPLAN